MLFLTDVKQERYDMVARYREAGITVWADHCPKCGRWARVVAGDSGRGTLPWARTDCRKCGVHEVTSEWIDGKGWVDTLVY